MPKGTRRKFERVRRGRNPSKKAQAQASKFKLHEMHESKNHAALGRNRQ